MTRRAYLFAALAGAGWTWASGDWTAVAAAVWCTGGAAAADAFLRERGR